jgi:tRNA pseudouridine55 synthase
MKVNEEIILIDKPAGWTSFDVVAKLRSGIRAEYRERGEKPTKRQLKIGHAGTLDPFATGLLIILKGEATKKAGEFLKLDKVYEPRITLGRTSTTGDPEGELTDVSDAVPTKDDIERTLAQFVGDITQTPPAFSAIKVNGKRAYALAREGKEVEIPARVVRIYSLELLDYTYPNIRVRAHVGSGTYIRSLAQDIGAALGTGAYCSALRRTSISEWSVDDAGGIN